MIKINRNSFYPVDSLEKRSNYKRFFRIEPNGSVTECVFLDVPDISLREQLICQHYVLHLTKVFLLGSIGIKILGRDMPWDFKLQLSNGKIFNVEITSIADNLNHFIINKSEEFYKTVSSKDKIQLREIIKLSRYFPDENLDKVIEEHKRLKTSDNEYIINPLNKPHTPLFISTMPEPTAELDKLIRSAIDKKLNKTHLEKDNTALIIDNRTSAFSIEQCRAAEEILREYMDSIPFPEVWFYTGYCSDNDGNNAEFCFLPLKLRKEQEKPYIEFLMKSNIDKNGKIVC